MAAIPDAAINWVSGGDTGASSKSIWAHMAGGEQDATWGASYPHDPDDLGRCLRLLALVPEWRPRIGEMAVYGGAWAALAPRWDEVEASMLDEVGIAWEKARRAPKTYELMKQIERSKP